ncbi:uncharacterized protein METZ01_LOCUS505430, partial [marine metagenome]
VDSSATAFAPFSQNSAIDLCPSGSGHAQPGQSNPLNLFSLLNLVMLPITPICLKPCFAVEITAGIPAATVL